MKEKYIKYFVGCNEENKQLFYNLIEEDQVKFNIKRIQKKNNVINAEVQLCYNNKKGIVYYIGTEKNIMIISPETCDRPGLGEEVIDYMVNYGKSCFSYRISEKIRKEILKKINAKIDFSYISRKKTEVKKLSHVTIVHRRKLELNWETRRLFSSKSKTIAKLFQLESMVLIEWIGKKSKEDLDDNTSLIKAYEEGEINRRALYTEVGHGSGIKYELIDFETEDKPFDKGLDFLPIIKQNEKEESKIRYVYSNCYEYEQAIDTDLIYFPKKISEIEKDIKEFRKLEEMGEDLLVIKDDNILKSTLCNKQEKDKEIEIEDEFVKDFLDIIL